jgi:hypothetical protein
MPEDEFAIKSKDLYDILDNRKNMVLKLVYGKVDYETYRQIEEVFEVKV